MIKSPLIYQGNKTKLLPEILKHAHSTAYALDAFGGSGCVAATLNDSELFSKVIYSELNRETFEIVDALSRTDPATVRKWTLRTMKRYGLDAVNQNAYYTFRDKANRSEPMWLNMWLLSRHSHSNLLRFNQKRKFNVPFGYRSVRGREDEIFTDVERFYNAMRTVTRYCASYSMILKAASSKVLKNLFVYADPPYLASGANYYGAWSPEDDAKLRRNLDVLNYRGGKFLMSNVFRHRSFVNEPLIRWSKSYSVTFLNKTYCLANAQSDSHSTIEVFIKNY